MWHYCLFENVNNGIKVIKEYDDFDLNVDVQEPTESEESETDVEDEILDNYNSSEDDFTSKVRSRLRFDPSKYAKKRVNRKLFKPADFDLQSVHDTKDDIDYEEDDDYFDLGI